MDLDVRSTERNCIRNLDNDDRTITGKIGKTPSYPLLFPSITRKNFLPEVLCRIRSIAGEP
jgi:hypothetical protein